MCGRLTMHVDPEAAAAELNVEHSSYVFRERFNVPPGADLPIVLDSVTKDGEPVRRMETARWGLLPSWAKDPKIGFRAFNARSETVAEKPMFRAAFAQRHCVVPVSGYYEWQAVDGAKQPWLMHSSSGDWLYLAGLYEVIKATEWVRAGLVSPADPALADGWLASVTVLTQPAVGELREVHDRMPVFASTREAVDAWLETPADAGEARAQLDRLRAAHGEDNVVRYRVGTDVGNVRNNSADLIVPLAG